MDQAVCFGARASPAISATTAPMTSGAANQRPRSRDFLKCQPYPRRHQRRLEGSDQGRLSRRQVAGADNKQAETQAYPEEPEHRKRGKLG